MKLPSPRHLDHPLARVAYVDVGPDRVHHGPGRTAGPSSDTGPGAAPAAATAPSLLFIHGALCAHDDWAPAIDHFRARHRCVALDLPGHGDSPADPASIGVQPYARIVRDLAAALDLREVALVAHSMGCRVALQAAVGLGDEGPWPGLQGLALIDGAYLTPQRQPDATPAQRHARAGEARARAAGLYAQQDPGERAARGFGQMFFDPRFDALRDRMIARARRLPPHVARTLMPDFAGWDVEHMESVLSRIPVPVQAWICTYMNSAHERVRLQNDTRTPWMEALQDLVAQVSFERVPEAGHFPMLEQPQTVHDRLGSWLTRLSPPS